MTGRTDKEVINAGLGLVLAKALNSAAGDKDSLTLKYFQDFHRNLRTETRETAASAVAGEPRSFATCVFKATVPYAAESVGNCLKQPNLDDAVVAAKQRALTHKRDAT